MWDKLLSILRDTVYYTLSAIIDFIASVIALIPVPGFISNLPSLFSSIPASVIYFLEPFQIHIGLPMMVSAFVFRSIYMRLF